MPIYRCNQCGFVSEADHPLSSSQAPCGRCTAPCTIYSTVPFVEAIIQRLANATRELKQLKVAATAAATYPATSLTPTPATAASPPSHSTAQTSISQWFAARQIAAQLDPRMSDTSGFFDDSAIQIGDNYALLSELIDRVRFAYRKSHTTVTLELMHMAQKDAQSLTQFCRRLYEHTFFSRYFYQKPEKVLRLTLQSAPAVRQFFEGGWLEWYALVAVQRAMRNAHHTLLASARSVKVVFPNDDLHEIDVICLLEDNQPICIECKSGEFRRDIDKYLRLRKRLDIQPQNFVVLSPELTAEQANGLNAMYELSFVNLTSVHSHLQSLTQRKTKVSTT